MLSCAKYICLVFHHPRVVSTSPSCGHAHWATSSVSTLAPLSALLGVQFWVVPMQLGSADPHGVPQNSVRPSGPTILRTLGSVKHEGPPARKWQKGDICHALTTEAFTFFCQAYDGAMCSGPPRHHCLLPPHVVEDCTVFTSLSLRFFFSLRGYLTVLGDLC